jgi:dihydroxyacetone kinase
MDYVLETSKLLSSPMGVLHIINNYTGDRMAFDMGREMAEADGVTIKTLIVDDDVAVKDSTYTVGRRGVAGNFFVIKAVGAASEKGADLDELIRIGEKVNSVTRTMGQHRRHLRRRRRDAALRARRGRDGDGRGYPWGRAGAAKARGRKRNRRRTAEAVRPTCRTTRMWR